jgi:hypothetical protein
VSPRVGRIPILTRSVDPLVADPANLEGSGRIRKLKVDDCATAARVSLNAGVVWPRRTENRPVRLVNMKTHTITLFFISIPILRILPSRLFGHTGHCFVTVAAQACCRLPRQLFWLPWFLPEDLLRLNQINHWGVSAAVQAVNLRFASRIPCHSEIHRSARFVYPLQLKRKLIALDQRMH